MRLVAVTRILNEDDIVEAFVRHHAAIVDHHLLLDNGSVDRTLEILACLKAEGVALSVLQNVAPFYAEVDYNTNLFNMAVQSLGADWVLFLDADEFLDTRGARDGARAWFESLHPDVVCLAVQSREYLEMPGDDAAEAIVPLRIRSREATPLHASPKIVVRGTLQALGIAIEGGQHAATRNGEDVPSTATTQFALAHYYRRNAWQVVAKSVMGHLKVAAAGKRELNRQRSFHYRSTFESARDAPERLLTDPGFLDPSYADRDLIEDPLPYLGGPLRHTRPGDPRFKAMRVLIAYAEQLAASHGTLIDTNEGIRLQAHHMAGAWTHLF